MVMKTRAIGPTDLSLAEVLNDGINPSWDGTIEAAYAEAAIGAGEPDLGWMNAEAMRHFEDSFYRVEPTLNDINRFTVREINKSVVDEIFGRA